MCKMKNGITRVQMFPTKFVITAKNFVSQNNLKLEKKEDMKKN